MASYNFKNIYEWPPLIRILIAGLFFLVVFYMGYYFDISGLTRQASAIQQQEDGLKEQIEIIYNKRAVLEGEIAQLPLLRNKLTDWQKKLIRPSELPELLNQIFRLGTANQLQFDFFNPGAETKKGVYTSLPIKVVVLGNYHQIANFISQVANMPTIIEVTNLSIARSEQQNSASQGDAAKTGENLTAQLLLEVYHLDGK